MTGGMEIMCDEHGMIRQEQTTSSENMCGMSMCDKKCMVGGEPLTVRIECE